jgi:N-methylhydantoinase A
VTYRIGIDVGGTFTDFLVVGDDDMRLVHKTSSTPDDPSRGVVAGLDEIAAELGVDPTEFLARVGVIVHGTTVTTNAVLTHSGAPTGLLVTEGFRDVLALRDGTREAAYDNRLPAPTPLVPRYLRLGVPGRIDYKGDELAPLDEHAVRRAAATLRSEGVEAVAISFMHSPANGSHEQRAQELVRELLPDAYVTASSELLPQVRYYPRTSTVVLNAYVGPIITRYLEALTRRLEELRFGGVLLIMQSNGGVATPTEVSRRAALSLLSGPASGPTAGLWHLAPHGLRDCITIDMGGTSFDTALVRDGVPLVMTDGVVDRWRLALPMIDIHTIGAGGGSVAHVDEGGLLHVGPRSAGAVPGPACYARGGTEPTTTDADLVLGFLDEATFLGGAMRLDRRAALEAIAQVAQPLHLSAEEAAAGIYDIVNVNMAAGVREVSVRRGFDPRDFPLVVAGGAGPVHAAAIARELEIPLLVVPRESSIFCAAGMLMSDFKHDFVRAAKTPLAHADLDRLGSFLGEMAAEGRQTLERERVRADAIELRASVDLRYVGQWHELTVPVDWQEGRPLDRAELAEGFHREHDALFGYSSPEMPVELLAVRLSVLGRTEKPAVAESAPAAAEPTPSATRPVWSPTDRALLDTPVYDGRALGPGAALSGPAVVELVNTTIIVLAGFELVVDRFGSFVVWRGDRGRELALRLVPETEALVA